MFEGYLRLGGNEIANSERTYEYVSRNLPNFPLRDVWDTRGNLQVALGDAPYYSPLQDDAPWFDANDPTSREFYGFYPLELINAVNDTRQASITEGILDGGTVGSMRWASRSMRMRGLLVAKNDLALNTGLTWLKSALTPSPCEEHGGSCGGSTACLFAAMPDMAPCWEETYEAGYTIPLGSITPDSPYSLVLTDENIKRGTFTIPYTDGTVVRWGVSDVDGGYIREQHGPIISRRTNALINPSFTSDTGGWLSGGRTLTRVPTGGVDNGAYARTSQAGNRFADPSFDTVTAGTGIARVNLTNSPRPVPGAIGGWNGPTASYAGDGWAMVTAGASTPYIFSDRMTEAVVVGDVVTMSARVKIVSALSDFPLATHIRASVHRRSTNDYFAPLNVTPIPGTGIEFNVSATWVADRAVSANDLDFAILPSQAAGNLISPGAGFQYAATNLLIERGDQLRTFFDGATPDANGWDFGWAGTAGASNSTAKAARTVVWTNTHTNPSMESVNAGASILRTNQFLDPSCTVAGNFSGTADTTRTIATAGPLFGPSFVRMTVTALAGLSTGMDTSATAATMSAGLVALSAYVRPSGTCTVQAFGIHAAAASAVGVVNTPVLCPAGVWTRVAWTGTLIASGQIGLRLRTSVVNAIPVNGTFDVDGILFEQGGVVRPYFDGDTVDALGWDYGWAGTANASASTAKALLVEQRRNICTDPSATAANQGTLGFGTGRWFGGGGTAAGTYSFVAGATDGPTGLGLSTYVRKTWTAPPPVMANSSDTGFNIGGVGTSGFPVTPGQVITLSGYVRPSVQRNTTARVYQWDAAGAAFSTPVVSGPLTPAAPNAWTRISLTYTVPTGVSFVSFVLDSTADAGNGAVNWAVGSTFDATGALIEYGAVLRNYFDGTRTFDLDTTSIWVGTVNASASVLATSGPALAGGGSANGSKISMSYQRSFRGDASACATLLTGNPGNQGITLATNVVGATFVAGGTVTVIARVYVPSGTPNVSIGIQGTGIASLGPGTTVTQKDTWVLTSRTATLSAAGNIVSYVLTAAASTIDQQFFVDTVAIIPGTYSGPYFDGTIGALGDLQYQWGGVEHASYTNAWAVVPGAATNVASATAIITQDGISSPQSLRYIWSGAPTVARFGLALPGVTGGVTYTLSFKARASVDVTFTSLNYRPSMGVSTGQVSLSSSESFVAGVTRTLNYTFTAPAGAQANPGLAIITPTGYPVGTMFDIDDVELQSVTLPGSIRTPDIDAPFGPVVASFALADLTQPVTVSIVTVPDNVVIGTMVVQPSAGWQRFYLHSPFGRKLYVAFESIGDFSIDQGMVEAGSLELGYFDGSMDVQNPLMLTDGDNAGGSYETVWEGLPNASKSIMTWVNPEGVYPTPEGSQLLTWGEQCEDFMVWLNVDSGALAAGALLDVALRLRIDPAIQVIPYERNFHDVTCTSGPAIIQKINTDGGVAYEVDFVLTAGKSFAYGDTVDIITRERMSNLPTETFVDVPCTVADTSPILDPDCPPLPAAPRPPAVPNLCIANPETWERYTLEIPGYRVAAWNQSLPTIVLNTPPTQDVRQVRVRFTPNPFGYDPSLLDPCAYCSEFILSYLPANAELSVDGLVQKAWATVAGGAPRPASQLLYGTDGTPMTWPELSCGIDYVMTVDVPPTDLSNVYISLALTKME